MIVALVVGECVYSDDDDDQRPSAGGREFEGLGIMKIWRRDDQGLDWLLGWKRTQLMHENYEQKRG